MILTSRGYSAAGPGEARALRSGSAADVREALLAVRERTLALADAVLGAIGTTYPGVAYAPELNPPLWELGHVAWFQEWWIARNRQRAAGIRCDPDHAREPSLLPRADGWYDSSRVAHRTRWTLPLPDADATRDYLSATLAQTLQALEQLPAHPSDDVLYFFRLVALHEMMHAEAATYMAQNLGIALGDSAPAQWPCEPAAELELPAQRWRVGSEPDGFAFDNELSAHDAELGAIRIDDRPVSWARFLPFVEGGGYGQAHWWSDVGRDWLGRHDLRHPRVLRRAGAGWQQRLGERWQPLDPRHAAVHLTAFEAQAWCRWAGRRLPTEAEWECAALTLPGFAWGQVWEWTASAFEPYAGFAPHPYRDYSAPWFGTRRVLRGACPATSPALAHARYRNFFEPQRGDVFVGFRSCADQAGGATPRGD
jgi:gamma-glutamyl hercynylcysteine S-oxide synthase